MKLTDILKSHGRDKYLVKALQALTDPNDDAIRGTLRAYGYDPDAIEPKKEIFND